MSQPTPYNRLYNLTEYATANPGATYNPAQHDAELNGIETTLDGLCANIAQIQRDDGKLANASVHPDSLSTATKALIASTWLPRGLWATTTAYAVGDVIDKDGVGYVCGEAHTSGTFSTDYADGKWVSLGVQATAASAVAFTPAGSISSSTVQTAIEELDSEKAPKASPTFTGQVLVPSTAGTATLAFTGDTNTGLVQPSADQLSVMAGGNSRLTVTSTGGSTNGAWTHSGAITFSSTINAQGASSFSSGVAFTGAVTFGTATVTTVDSSGKVGVKATIISQSALTVGGSISVNSSDGDFASGNQRAVIDLSGNTARVGGVSGGSGAGMSLSLISAINSVTMHLTSGGCVVTGGATSAATGYSSTGDVTLPSTGAIRAKNTIKAWVKFDGTSGSIGSGDDSFNCSSITDLGTGTYRMNFTNAIANSSYAVLGGVRGTAGSQRYFMEKHDTPGRDPSYIDVYTFNASAALADSPVVSIAIIGS